MSAPILIRGRCTGRVQGVGFRAALSERARAHGLRGWVRNTDEGAVEFLAEGAPAGVEALLEWAREGPPGARVDAVGWTELAPDVGAGPLPPEFEVHY